MKKFLCSMLSVLMVTSAIGPITANASSITTAGTGGNSTVVLNVDAPTFSVTVPTGLPIYVDSEGVVTTADDVYITNSGHGSVTVTGVAITAKNNWSTVDVTKDLANVPVNTQEFSMTINNETTTGADTITFNQENWPAIAAANDGDTDQFHLVYDADVAPQTDALNKDIADMVFTIGWNLNGTSASQDDDESDSVDTDIKGPEASGIIPEGGTYYVKVASTSDTLKSYTGATEILEAGDPFPSIVNTNDVYVYDNYEYRYNYYYTYEKKGSANVSSYFWKKDTSQQGWGVRVISTSETTANPILFSIAGQDVVNLKYALANWSKLTIIDNEFNIPSNAINLNYCFYAIGATNLPNNLCIPSTANDLSYMFGNCDFTTLPSSLTIPNNVTDTSYMFYKCNLLTSLPNEFSIGNNVENTSYMFCDCEALSTLSNSFSIPSSVRNMDKMFYHCYNLTENIEIDANPESYESAFSNVGRDSSGVNLEGSSALLPCFYDTATSSGKLTVTIPEYGTYFTGVTTYYPDDLSGYETATIIKSQKDFPAEPKYGDVYIWGEYEYRYNSVYTSGKLPDSAYTSYIYTADKSLDGWSCRALSDTWPEYGPMLSTIGDMKVLSASYALHNCDDGVLSDDFSFPKYVEDLDYVFTSSDNIASMTQLPKSFVIPNTAVNISHVFYGFSNLTTLPDSFVIPDSVIDASYLFANCTSLSSIDGLIIGSNVEDVSSMFYRCSSLGKINLTIPSSVKDIGGMFSGCVSLHGDLTINAPSFNSTNNIFYNACTSSETLTLHGTYPDLQKLIPSDKNIIVAS